MSIIQPEIEYVDRTSASIRYLEHGWPSDLCRWHSHEDYELHLIVKTKGRAFIGNYIGQFSPGALFLTGPHLPHNWITEQSHERVVTIRDMLVQFNQKSLAQMAIAFPEFLDMTSMFEGAKSGIEFIDFNPTFARGHLESIRDTKGSERIVSLLRFLVRIKDHAEKKILSSGPATEFGANSKHAQIAGIIDHISNHYAEDLSIASCANIAGMSEATFTRHFQKVTGKNFINFLNTTRIAKACTLLYASEDKISTICYEVGFQNLSHFNRQFRRVKQMTPTTYRHTARVELLNRNP